MDYYILGYNQMYILTHSLTHSLIHSFTLPTLLPASTRLPTYTFTYLTYFTYPTIPHPLLTCKSLQYTCYIIQSVHIPARPRLPACLPACLPCLLFAFLWLEIVAYYGYIDKAVHSGVRRWRWHWCLWGNNMSDSK